MIFFFMLRVKIKYLSGYLAIISRQNFDVGKSTRVKIRFKMWCLEGSFLLLAITNTDKSYL